MKERLAQTLVENGIGIMVVVIVIGAVTVPVVQNSLVLDTTNVNNETFNATSDPFTYTVSSASNDDFKRLDTVTCYTDTAQSSEQTCSILDAEAGTVNVSGATDADDESIDYGYQPDGYVESSSARTVLSYLDLILVTALFLAAISLVR